MDHFLAPPLSIIIPTLNEAQILGSLLKHLRNNSSEKNIREIIVVDGGSNDQTVEIAEAYRTKVIRSKRGRAHQMNVGSAHAAGELLYFLHADTFPPKDFDKIIVAAYHSGKETGCFRMAFDSNNIMLKTFAYLSRINHTLCRGGDQSLFISKSLFRKQRGFNENYLIYEDSEFITRLYRVTNFIVLPQKVTTSARKYREKGWLKVQFHFGMIHLKNYLGAGPEELYAYYSKKLLS